MHHLGPFCKIVDHDYNIPMPPGRGGVTCHEIYALFGKWPNSYYWLQRCRWYFGFAIKDLIGMATSYCGYAIFEHCWPEVSCLQNLLCHQIDAPHTRLNENYSWLFRPPHAWGTSAELYRYHDGKECHRRSRSLLLGIEYIDVWSMRY